MAWYPTDLSGTAQLLFKLGLNNAAVVALKAVSNGLSIRNVGDTADASLTASQVNVSGSTVVINSGASGSGSSWKYTLQTPASGMTAAVTLTLPTTAGSSNQVLQTDGTGVLSWAAQTSVPTNFLTSKSYTVSYNSSSTITATLLPANAFLDHVDVCLDTSFNGTAPTLSVGTAGNNALYMSTSQNNLQGTATDIYTTHPNQLPSGSTTQVNIYYTASTASVGSCRVIIWYTIPG